MAEESKPVKDLREGGEAPAPSGPGKAKQTVESDDESGSEVEAKGSSAAGDDGGKKKKKKSKKSKAKQVISQALAGSGSSPDAVKDPKKAIEGLTTQQVTEFMTLNPALADELRAANPNADPAALAEIFKKLRLQDIMTGLATSGKNRKDLGAYKFWATQPVPQFGDEKKDLFEEGPLRVQKIEDIPKEPEKLALDQFRWVTMDLTDEAEMAEVEKLLYGHYVEDDEAMFRFKYSMSILKWSLLSPGWKKEWHVGIRSGNTLCAFISAIPVDLRVRDKVLKASEVNFLCVHKKLRGKRLAPVLIKEITRLCNLEGVFQAIYTGGNVLPRPVSTCRYFHRALNWTKLNECGFSHVPPNSKAQFQVRKFHLPESTSTRGLREMQVGDIDAVHSLLGRYLKRFDLAPSFTKEEIGHWLLNKDQPNDEKVVWVYVVEDADGKITDMFSFYLLESSVIKNPKHSSIRAAYLFYYATEAGLTTPVDKSALKTRLNDLMHDALILAKGFDFDVFNALSLMDNALFLEQQKFGAGDGQLHYYLFNYKANPIAGGVNVRNELDPENLSGVAFVAL